MGISLLDGALLGAQGLGIILFPLLASNRKHCYRKVLHLELGRKVDRGLLGFRV